MKEKELYCPVSRLENPGVKLEIKETNNDLINIKANINIKNPIKVLIDKFNKE